MYSLSHAHFSISHASFRTLSTFDMSSPLVPPLAFNGVQDIHDSYEVLLFLSRLSIAIADRDPA